jgi:hypothetical protein
LTSSWDPNEIGPFDRCLRCFTPYNNDFAFCLKCGKIGTVFDVPIIPEKGFCMRHKKPFIGYCCLCGHAICAECGHKSFHSLLYPFRKFFYCNKCLEKSKKIEEAFFKELEKKMVCAKHSETKAEFRCIECGLLLCRHCAYFSRTGLIIKRVDKGPYCLTCFRTKVQNKKSWISGEAVTWMSNV